MFALRVASSPQWTKIVLADFDAFLIDHAAAEKKASGMALSLALHYRDREYLVEAMTELAIEELVHFRAVIRLLHQRGLQLQADEKDAYVNQLRDAVNNHPEKRMLDRLLLGAIIELRGVERFAMVAQALPAGDLQRFYQSIANSERQHNQLFIDLSKRYFPSVAVSERLDQLLDLEASIVEQLPLRPALH